MRITLSLLLVMRGLVILGQNADSLICTPYLDNGLVVSYANGFDFSSSYTASGSIWAIDSFPESQVFHAQIDYTSSVDTTESFSFRVGKGGISIHSEVYLESRLHLNGETPIGFSQHMEVERHMRLGLMKCGKW